MRLLFIFLIVFFSNRVFAQSSIKDARQKDIGETVTVSGIAINGDELGLIKYLQDTTAGIAVYDDKLASTQRGDSITVTGKLVDYNNLLEISDVTTFTKHSSNNQLPEPKIINISDIGEDYEGQLIKLTNIELSDAGGTFAGNENYNFSDGDVTGVLRISSSSPIIGKSIPTGKIELLAICAQYSRDNNDTRNGYQLLPRNMDDFISTNAINITSPIAVAEITKQSIKLSWETDVEATAELKYGNTPNSTTWTNFSEGTSVVSDEGMSHEAEVVELQAAEIVYLKAFSVAGMDTAFSATQVFISESNSTGKINVYFNSNIDEGLAVESVAKDIGSAMEDTLAAYINRAEESIDLCIYNFDNDVIKDALNLASDRGIQIRVITCESTSHYSINQLNSEIPVLERPEIQEGGIMHNKFAVIDADVADANQAWVWSGSTNLTSGQLLSDANNMIFIQDQSLAKTYKIEFEEMWGSAGNTPSASKAKFGNEKTNNTPHELLIGGNRVECYFSPSDNTNQQLINALETADNDLNVQTMLITRSDLANAIIDAHERGVEVNVLTDDERDNSETANNILDDLPNDKFIFDDKASGTMHHKMAIIDAKKTGSDSQVITGSHNWSNNANTRNDENTLIIHSADITNQYYQQFAYRFVQNEGDLVVSTKEIQIKDLKIYPNPTQNRIFITTNGELKSIELYSTQGALIQQKIPTNKNSVQMNLSSQKSGIYILKVEENNGSFNTYKIIKK